jgi:hypothetical protein
MTGYRKLGNRGRESFESAEVQEALKSTIDSRDQQVAASTI